MTAPEHRRSDPQARRRRRVHRGGDAALVRRAALRLGVQAAVGTALVVALLATATAVILLRDQNDAADVLLADTVSRADDVDDPPAGTWLVIRYGNRTEHTPGLPAGLPLDSALDRVAAGGPPELADVDGRPLRVRTQVRDVPGRGPAAVAAVLDLRPGQAQRASLLRALLIGGLAGLALAALAGTWLGRRAVRPLEAALTMQRRFVADASHELRTPLTLLSTRTQLLRRRLYRSVIATELRTDVDGVVADADRLTAILDDLLLAADPHTDTPDEAVDLAVLAEDVVGAATPAAGAARITISTRIDSNRVTVTGSPAGLRRALVALTDNAIRHARHRVTVAVGATPRTVVVEVSDDGPGIDDDVLPHMFDRFASATDGPARHYGLGLALVSEIVNRHGGTITASTSADGAVLRIELPSALRRPVRADGSPTVG